MSYIHRIETARIKKYLENFPSVAILGPRQCGKLTLAKHLLIDYPESVFLDLEYPEDRMKLTDPLLFFQLHAGKLICLDEIRRVPDLFPLLRTGIAGIRLSTGNHAETLDDVCTSTGSAQLIQEYFMHC